MKLVGRIKRQRDQRFNAKRAAVAGKQPGRVRPELAQEAARLAAVVVRTGRAGTQYLAACQHHVHRNDRFGRCTVRAGAVANGVLRHRTTHGGDQAGERSKERRPPAARRQRLAQRRPGTPGLDRHGAIGIVDGDDAIEAAHIDRNTAAGLRQIGIGVRRTTAFHDDSETRQYRFADGCNELIESRRRQHRSRHFAPVEDIGSGKLAVGQTIAVGRLGQRCAYAG